MARQACIVGAIVVKASPLPENNHWVLDVLAKDKIIIWVIGNLLPGTPDFDKPLGRFHESPLFPGIRYANL